MPTPRQHSRPPVSQPFTSTRYPERRKSAKVKKHMQALQQLIGHHGDDATLLSLARARGDTARHRQNARSTRHRWRMTPRITRLTAPTPATTSTSRPTLPTRTDTAALSWRSPNKTENPMPTLTLYTNPHSRGTNVRWMLEECGADYNTVAVPFGAEMKAPAYRAINPMGKVPALTHGDTVLTETVAIITWPAEHYPQKALIPAAGSETRAANTTAGSASRCTSNTRLADRMRAIENSEELRTAIGYGDFDTAFAVLKACLQDCAAHIIGEQFTALDLYYSGLLNGSSSARKCCLPIASTSTT